MSLSGLFSWGWGHGKFSHQQKEDSRFKWEELPQLVKLEIFKYLDREALNNLRQISATARTLIEHNHGLHVILPARNYKPAWAWRMMLYPKLHSFGKKSIRDSLILHILHQMEGKKIFALEMDEMPPTFSNPFPFERFVQYPNWLLYVSLRFVDVDLIHKVFSQCRNLTTFKYETAYGRSLPRGPLAYAIVLSSFSPVSNPAVHTRLIKKINGFPSNPPNAAPMYQLTRLKSLHLTIDKMTFIFGSDWGNVIYMLMALPVLPSLTKFMFQFNPRTHLYEKTHVLILSCLGEFLLKTPNLEIFQYRSTFFVSSPFWERHQQWMKPLKDMINKFGSNRLREMARVTGELTPMHSFLQLAKNILNIAGRSLRRLQELNLELRQENEHSLFTSFICHLQSPNLTSCQITDSGLEELTVNNTSRVQKLFLLSLASQPENLSVYQNVIELYISLGRIRTLRDAADNVNGYMILSKTLSNLPNLKVLSVKQVLKEKLATPSEWVLLNEIFGTTADDVQDMNIFSKLEKLSLENFCISGLVTNMLLHCKYLKELYFKYPDFRSFSGCGFSSEDLLKVLTALPKLDKVHVDPVYSLSLEVETSVIQELPHLPTSPNVLDRLRKAINERNVLSRLGKMERITDIANNVQDFPLGKYEFMFHSDSFN